jgi:hypothetical protein
MLDPCIGQDSRLDDIHLIDTCVSSELIREFHDSYRCASMDQVILMFSSFINDTLAKPLANIFTADSRFYHLFHIMNFNMIDITYESVRVFSSIANMKIGSVRAQLSELCFGSILVIIIDLDLDLGLFLGQVWQLEIAFDCDPQLLLRLLPLAITEQADLLTF